MKDIVTTERKWWMQVTNGRNRFNKAGKCARLKWHKGPVMSFVVNNTCISIKPLLISIFVLLDILSNNSKY